MTVAVLQFPGSNCDQDAYHLFASGLGLPTRYVWHKKSSLGEAGLVVVPGGFSYGDYLRCGAIARFSPVMGAVREFAEKGGLVLGICNGFQILCEAGLLPGALIRNSCLEYRCMVCELAVQDSTAAFNPGTLGASIRLPIGHGEGNYRTDEAGLARLEANRQILFRYVRNPNGSLADIAGIRNERGNVFGMMPHPDRAFERFHPSQDGLAVAKAVIGGVVRSAQERNPGASSNVQASPFGLGSAPAGTDSKHAGTLPPNPDPVLNQPVTPELIKKHGLLPEEYQRILSALGREPMLTELGIFSVMWSEHCSYKNTRPLLKGFPTERKGDTSRFGRVLVKAGEENAGIVDIGGGWAIAFKIESHNHPSAVEPFEGAATGVGGIIRDIFTMGARPVLLTNSLRFGDLRSPATRRLLRGVVAGIAHYGNCVGVPTVGGDITFDACYEGNPLVNALCLGTLRHDQIRRGRATGVGNPVYYVGAATGRDGLGGAAFASKELSAGSGADRPAVQKGDPFMEKLLIEACLEMMAVPGLVVGIQDMGAAGLTCSTCETASRGGAGIEIELDCVPQRETGMNSYEIMLSESQERMLVIVQAGREREIEDIFAKWDLHAARVGLVTDTGRMEVRHHGVTVADIPAGALTDQAPVYHREARENPALTIERAWTPEAAGLPDLDAAGVEDTLPRLLAHPTIASKRWIYRQYDHMVQHGTVVAPGSDAAVVRLRLGEGAERFIAISNDCNGRYCLLNPRRGAMIAMAECLRNLACSGARALAMTDNLNFGNPYKPGNFFALRECVAGLAEACRFFDVPVVGGNVSLYNESPGGTIDPTPVVSVVGIIEDERHVTRQFVRGPGETLILLGGAPHELGGSQYLGLIHGLKTGDAPVVDFAAEARLQDFLLAQIAAGRIRAAHDLSEGGLMVALAEMLFGRGQADYFEVGADLKIIGLTPSTRVDALLFGESQGRVVVAVNPADGAAVVSAASAAGVPAQAIGASNDSGKLTLSAAGIGVEWGVSDLRRAWETAIEEAMKRPGIDEP